jgi:integrase
MSRKYRTGSIDQRSPDTFRIRYRVAGRVWSKTLHGSKADATRALRAALKAADDGAHVAPDKITVAAWIETWLSGLQVSARTAERYAQLLRGHVVPVLGSRRLQSIQGTDIKALYRGLQGIKDRTRHHVHVVLGTCLRAAVEDDMLVRSPVKRKYAPRVESHEIGKALGRDELAKLLKGFVGHPLHLFVTTAVATGARRNEILALRWADFDSDAKSLSITHAVEETKAHGRRMKSPKTKTGVRTITIDNELAELLRAEREKYLRLVAGVLPGDGIVDLTLVKLHKDALIFPAPPQAGERGFELTRLRDANAVTRTFQRQASKVGFAGLRLHDLRHTHGSRLIAAGLSIPVVASRLGHKPEVLLKVYAHEIKAAEERKTAAEIIAALSVNSGATGA